jgi:hypothetical protein
MRLPFANQGWQWRAGRLRLVFAVFQIVAVKAGNAEVAGNLESSQFKISIVLDIMMSFFVAS